MNILEGRPGLFERLHGEWLEIIAAVLLALATTASAWCAYQASRWHSEEALRFNEAMTARVHAAEADDLADTELAIDVAVFLEYSMALRDGDDEKARYVENRIFRDEMKGAVEAWKAAGRLSSTEPPRVPRGLRLSRVLQSGHHT